MAGSTTILFNRAVWDKTKKQKKFLGKITITTKLLIGDRINLVPLPREGQESLKGEVTFFERISPEKANVGIKCV